ncbi:unnamed protein product [Heligmosomoides polygyrus]|uniref:Uncharacterized protein n=1 Tax=Heligmosomoides polygyrus TaxID=6339 RepID=A0A183GIT0_HELPZ|nr:unnamed protein product [Heligmosomoides polygyrus]
MKMEVEQHLDVGAELLQERDLAGSEQEQVEQPELVHPVHEVQRVHEAGGAEKAGEEEPGVDPGDGVQRVYQGVV